MLPAPPGLSAAAACGPAERALRPAAAACGPAERALRPAARAWPACRMRPPLPSCLCPPRPAPPRHLARVHRRRLIRVALRRPHRVHRAQPSGTPPIAVGMSRLSVSSCCPRAAPRRRIAPTDARSLAPPEPQPAPTEPRPRANRASPARGATCAHPRPATRRASPCRAGPAAVPVIPVKWCGDTIAHTRKLRF